MKNVSSLINVKPLKLASKVKFNGKYFKKRMREIRKSCSKNGVL